MSARYLHGALASELEGFTFSPDRFFITSIASSA
jgi:hypothetical protein